MRGCQGAALGGLGWDQCECCAEWCGRRNGVVAEEAGLGGLRAAAVGVPRQQGAGWHGGGTRCKRCFEWHGMHNSVVAEGSGCGRVGEAAVGVPRQVAG
jgi:hypothetical protein